MSKLIYVMDPLCGWCYGNSANTQHLYDTYKNQIDFEILPAGMWIGENARKQSKPMAQYIKKHDFKVFGWYRIVLGLLVLLYFLVIK